MINSIYKSLLILALIAMDFVHAGTLREGVKRQTGEVYSVSSVMKWNVFAPNPYLFSTTEMYYLQQTASSFLEEKIKESPHFDKQNVIRVDYKVKGQTADVNQVQSMLTAQITMIYGGRIADNFAELLPMVVDSAEAENLMRIFIQNDFFEESSTSANMKFQSDGTSELLANDGFTMYMIIFIVLLTLSSVLAVVSLAFLCSSKCCNRRDSWRKDQQEQELKLAPTQESNDPNSPTSPEGILGARVQPDGEIIITPQRGIIHHEYEDTPMSQDSNLTGAKSIYSTTSSKAPLGILSMNNLKKILHSPKRQPQGSVALYNVGLDDDGDSTCDQFRDN